MSDLPSIPATIEDLLENVENAVYRVATSPHSTNMEVLRAAIILFKRYEVGAFSKSKAEKPVRMPLMPTSAPPKEPSEHLRYPKPLPDVEENHDDLDAELWSDQDPPPPEICPPPLDSSPESIPETTLPTLHEAVPQPPLHSISRPTISYPLNSHHPTFYHTTPIPKINPHPKSASKKSFNLDSS